MYAAANVDLQSSRHRRPHQCHRTLPLAMAALINFGYIANAVLSTDEFVKAMG